ncbi:MAG: hypothetical protein AAGA08_17065 [Pseudomonadota bacterium]
MSKNKKSNAVQTRVRISDQMHKCIDLMILEGLPLPLAAERADITRDTAVKNMRKPHVLQLFNQKVREVRENAAQAAYIRMSHLAVSSDSERIGLDANRWLAGVDGIAPVQKVQGSYSINHTFGGFVYPDLEPDDVMPVGDD